MTSTQLRTGSGRDALLTAAARLLREVGVQGFTTRAVAAAAGVQPPAIYRAFGDKDGLLAAVAEAAIRDYVASKGGAGTDPLVGFPADPVDGLRAAWRLHVGFGLENPEIYALMGLDADPVTAIATRDGIDALRMHVDRLRDAGLLTVGEERAVQMIHATGHGVVLALLEQPPAERDAGLADAVLEAVVAAITLQPSPPGSQDLETLALCVDLARRVPGLPALRGPEKSLLMDWLRRVIEALRRGSAPATDA